VRSEELGAWSLELGARGWELKLGQPPYKTTAQKKGSLKRPGFCRILCCETYPLQFINATDYWHTTCPPQEKALLLSTN
jgi:hypothetical protein